MKSPLLFAVMLTYLWAAPAQAGKLVVHEWGTFTSLQDGKGGTVAGVNTDDEPVPSFVHSLGGMPSAHSEMAPAFQAMTTKGGVPRLHPDVTIRLETPVMYFYLPKGKKSLTTDVDVSFRGGWLTQYYPDAVSGTAADDIATQHLTGETTGTLSWKGLVVGAAGNIPVTDESVWLAPRHVHADPVSMPSGEAEQFLFYRGVGSAGTGAPPVIATQSKDGVALQAKGVNTAWLADIRDDGTVAFGTGVAVKGNVQFYPAFDAKDYTDKNAAKLKAALHRALEKAGLYKDEATALLETWDRSYFKSPGERVLYIMPRRWVDAALPLKISAPASITRVMVGRIELVGPQQRQALERMRAGVAGAAADFIHKAATDVNDWPLFQDVQSGKKPVSALGLDVPPVYRDYLSLGRFRDAILLEENRDNPSPAIAAFIRDGQISMYDIPADRISR